MNTSTLITKVLLPRQREDVLHRHRLLNRLYDMVDCKVIVISAPAGYGKTTLLVDFAHDLEHPVCWYTLDESDRDPRVFLEHLVLSLQHRFPNFGERTRRALSAGLNLDYGAPSVVNELLNEIVDTIPRWFVLVLDDYHRLGEAREVGAILARCLAYQGDQFLLTLASRIFPELPSVIQLTARNELGGLDQDDLRFRATEVQSLLAQNHNLHVSEKEAENLVAQSEGWITGILLSAHTMWQDIIRKLVRARTSEQPVYEYLAQEVFAQQEPSVQTFLTASSALQEMNPMLCQEALGLEEAADLLALLDDRNLFVIRLEEEWCRYHHLFREYLQARLRREDETAWRELHRRAADWFTGHRQLEKAVCHYLTIDDYETATHVMETAVQDVFYAGHLETLMMWGAALPDPLRERAPRLALFQSRAATNLGRWEEALALTEVAERGYQAHGDEHGLVYTWLHRCQIWQEQGRFQDTLLLGQKALLLIEQADMPVAYEAHRILGRSCSALGRLEEGESHLRQALACCPEQEGDFERSLIQSDLADCLWWQGYYEDAVAVQRQAVTLQERVGNPSALSGMLNDLGFYLYSNGEYDQALPLFEQALELARRSNQRRSEAFALVSWSELARDVGALEQALDACKEGLSIADELGDGFLSAYGREALGLVHRRRGDYSQAQVAIAQALERAEQQRSEYQLGRYGASLGLMLVEAGEVKAGLAELASARERLERVGAQGELARARFFTAWALFQIDQKMESLAYLQQVLDTKSRMGRDSFLVVEGQRVFSMLEYARAQEINSEELTGLLDRARSFEYTAQAILGQVSPLRAEAGVGTAEPLRIFGFGQGRVERGGEQIPSSDWETESARMLLFYLLTCPNRSRDQIVAALWQDLPPHRVKATFHTTKFRLKRALSQDAVYFDGYSYQVHPDLDYWFDVEEFERLLEGDQLEGRLKRLQQAINLYQGDLLEDCYADWAVPYRRRLRERYLKALNELVEQFMARRQYSQAIQVLHRGLEVDDLREDFHRQLMRVCAMSGRRSQAIAQYQRCTDILQHELGSDPSPETTALYQRILDGLPLD